MSNFRIYVGTYEKYNNGSIAGAWVDIEDMTEQEFAEAIEELHSDEEDPEYMFQDYEVPEAFQNLVSEHGIDDEFWHIKDWYNEQSETQQEAFDAFVNLGNDPDPVRFEDAYLGQYDSEAEFCEQLYDETGQLENIDQTLLNCIDWDMVWSSTLTYEFEFENGFVFRNY